MKLKWGIIGCGGIADRKTLPGMVKVENAEIYAVMDANGEVAEKVKEKYGAKYAFSKAEDLLALEEIDVVYIASPVFCHKEQAIMAAKAKKHIFLEKPIGISYSESKEIVETCEAEGVKLGIGFMMRYHAQHQKIKQLIADGVIGDIVSMRAQFICWYPKMENAWRQNKKLSGGGALVDMGIHCIDLLQYITGLDAVECMGIASNQTFDYSVDDSSGVIMKMENGSIAYIDSNFNIPDAASKCPMEFYGTKGSIITKGTLGQAPDGIVELLRCDDSAEYDAQRNIMELKAENIVSEPVDMYMREIEEFSNAIINDTVPPVNGRDTLKTHKIVDLIYQSGGGKL